MPGFNPNDVHSPMDKWTLLEVLYWGPNWSLALGRWKHGRSFTNCLAMRWNGKDGEKGNPTSRGYPTWFNVPDEIAPILLDTKFVPPDVRERVRKLLPMDKTAALQIRASGKN